MPGRPLLAADAALISPALPGQDDESALHVIGPGPNKEGRAAAGSCVLFTVLNRQEQQQQQQQQQLEQK